MKSHEFVKTYINPLFTRSYWQMLGDYVGIGKNKKNEVIADRDSLATFLGTRASHVAQTSLYGYLRTRAGTRFPEMFENPDILQSINIAKWHIWLACVSDLSLFAGQCMYQSGKLDEDAIQQLLPAALQQVLTETGEPEEAGSDFASAREKIVQRIATCDWKLERDDDTVFSQSPEALFYWSPIADELKEQDESIVKNSVRFRWIEVRRSARAMLDFEALAQATG
ncbi:MAG: esterase [Gammaproteobacteria bacterium]|nr:esterase [Gammaproteobacteria bacterium]